MLARDGREIARWPITTADLTTVDALARAQLTARRHGYDITIQQAEAAFARLFRLVGFAGLVVEVVGQAEGGEQARCRGSCGARRSGRLTPRCTWMAHGA